MKPPKTIVDDVSGTEVPNRDYEIWLDGVREVVEWGDEPCPHRTLTYDTSKANRRECDLCWETLVKEWGIK